MSAAISAFVASGLCADQAVSQSATSADSADYRLGPDDQIAIRVLDADEITDKPVRIDGAGNIQMPLVGTLRASGLTVAQFQMELVNRLRKHILEPQVTVNIIEYKSQPVSVLGAVVNPGIQQLVGRKTLTEMLSLAGGLDPDAGDVVKITRLLQWGDIPLPTAKRDSSGQFSVAEVRLNSLMRAEHPEENIIILPHDVISVPRAAMVYVVGEVERSGGFQLSARESFSVLQAVSLAGGIRRPAAAPDKSRILRTVKPGERVEIAVDLKRILAGKDQDIPLQAEDILFIPDSTGKRAVLHGLEMALQTGSGVVIWRSARY